MPTLVVWAEDDIALPIGVARGLEAYVPHMRLVRVPGATPLDHPRAPAQVVGEIERHCVS